MKTYNTNCLKKKLTKKNVLKAFYMVKRNLLILKPCLNKFESPNIFLQIPGNRWLKYSASFIAWQHHHINQTAWPVRGHVHEQPAKYDGNREGPHTAWLCLTMPKISAGICIYWTVSWALVNKTKSKQFNLYGVNFSPLLLISRITISIYIWDKEGRIKQHGENINYLY